MPELRRELGLRDVTLFAIACIVGVRWVPAAAHAGPGSVLLWLLAALFFVAPLAMAVGALAVKYPGAGGLYLWTRSDFGPWHGFLCFWIYWMGIAFWYPSAAMSYMTAIASMLGPQYAHLAGSRTYLICASLAGIWIAMITNMIGMKIGKWTENLGGIATWILGALFLVGALLVFAKRGTATHIDIIPKLNWETASFWATIAFAMSGLEMVGLMGAEIRDPERNLPRAGWIASGFATTFYATLTVALLVLLKPEQIGEMNGYAQAGEIAGRTLGLPWFTQAIAGLVFIAGVGQFGGLGASVSRLPFAVGVDQLLPAAFSRIHSRWHTPHVSILTLAGIASVLLVLIQLGDTMRAAYHAMVSLMVISGFIPYLYIFGSSWLAGKRISAACGLAVTALALACSVVPTEDVNRVWLFELKLTLGTIAVIGSAWLVYRRHVKHAAGNLAAPLPGIPVS